MNYMVKRGNDYIPTWNIKLLNKIDEFITENNSELNHWIHFNSFILTDSNINDDSHYNIELFNNLVKLVKYPLDLKILSH